jgi:hypothetical protein
MDDMEKEIRKAAKRYGATKTRIEKIVAYWNTPEVRKDFQRQFPNYADYPLKPAAELYIKIYWTK